MNFELYAAKTVRQVTSDVSTRFAEKESKSRPAISGFVDAKAGEMIMQTSSRVLFMQRATRLRATLEKVKDQTVIRGYVSTGVQKEQVYIIIAALAFVAITLFLNGQAIFAIIVGLVSGVAYVPLVGDHNNSQYLMKELKRATGARDKPFTGAPASEARVAPKAAAARKPAAKAPARPAAKPASRPKAPAPKKAATLR